MPPEPVAVKVTAVPTVPVVGPAMETDKAPGVIDMLTDPVAVFAFASVIVTETVNVPGELKVVVKLELAPVAGLPPVAVQENEYGVVPPDPVAVNVTGVPTPAEVGPATVTASVNGLIVIDTDAAAVLPLASVIVTETVSVPFTLYVVEKLAPVPVVGLPPVAVQAKVYGVVPPEPVAVKAAAVPTVPVVGPPIVTARANGLTVIEAEAVAVFALVSVTITETE